MITTSRSRGISRSTFLRLCSRAPRTTIRSLAMTSGSHSSRAAPRTQSRDRVRCVVAQAGRPGARPRRSLRRSPAVVWPRVGCTAAPASPARAPSSVAGQAAGPSPGAPPAGPPAPPRRGEASQPWRLSRPGASALRGETAAPVPMRHATRAATAARRRRASRGPRSSTCRDRTTRRDALGRTEDGQDAVEHEPHRRARRHAARRRPLTPAREEDRRRSGGRRDTERDQENHPGGRARRDGKTRRDGRDHDGGRPAAPTDTPDGHGESTKGSVDRHRAESEQSEEGQARQDPDPQAP